MLKATNRRGNLPQYLQLNVWQPLSVFAAQFLKLRNRVAVSV